MFALLTFGICVITAASVIFGYARMLDCVWDESRPRLVLGVSLYVVVLLGGIVATSLLMIGSLGLSSASFFRGTALSTLTYIDTVLLFWLFTSMLWLEEIFRQEDKYFPNRRMLID